MIRVLLASRASARGALENSIRSSPTLTSAGSIDPDHFPAELAGDVLLLEFEAIDGNDWRAIGDLPIPVILLLDSTEPSALRGAWRAGIRGAISWDATPLEVESAVQAVIAGLIVMPPNLVAELVPDVPAFDSELPEALSGRELEVLDLVAEGLSNKLIAQALTISEHTVKTHVASIFAKLGASSRTEAVSQAIRRGLVML